MSEIPDDVMNAALTAARKTVIFGGVRGEISTIGYDNTIDVIVEAIMAERVRCAKIVDGHPNAHYSAVRDAILLGGA